MKSYLAIALLLPALMFTACGKDEDTGSATDSTSTEQDEEEVSGNIHEVTTAEGDMTFTPEDLTIAVGDTVRFVMTLTHNAIEVSKETYDVRGREALEGGFQVDFEETKEITFSEAGIHYYVCQPHTTMNMIGTITVE